MFPKHFYASKQSVDIEQVRLLFQVLKKDFSKLGQSNDEKSDVTSSYPFNAFLGVIKYYRQYGLYRTVDSRVTDRPKGPIEWKATLQKSQPILSDSGLIYTPFAFKERIHTDSIITIAMASILESESLHLAFLGFKAIKTNTEVDRKLKQHARFYIKAIGQILTTTFRQSSVKLLNNLLSILKYLDLSAPVTLKNYNFARVWEKMVFEYLNKNLFEVNETGLTFIENINRFSFKSQYPKVIDSKRGWRILLPRLHN